MSSNSSERDAVVTGLSQSEEVFKRACKLLSRRAAALSYLGCYGDAIADYRAAAGALGQIGEVEASQQAESDAKTVEAVASQ